MSFKQLGLFRRRGTPPPSGVAIGTNKARKGLGLAIIVRPDVAQNLGWKTGERVGVALGEGPDEGLICLFKSPDGLRLYRATSSDVGQTWGGRCVIDPSYLPVEITLPRVSEEVHYETKDGALIAVLPLWAYQNLPPVPLSKFRVIENRVMPTKSEAQA